MSHERTNQERFNDQVIDATERSARLAGRHDAALRGAYDRIERLENAFLAYAKVKGDGDLVARLLKREDVRQAEPDRQLPTWPEPLPFPELPE